MDVFLCVCETDVALCTWAPHLIMNNDQSLPLSVSDYAIVCKGDLYARTHAKPPPR